MQKLICFFLAFGYALSGFAQEKVSPLKRADIISVKAALEDMLVRRYTQELSSVVNYDHFNIGARFELGIVDFDTYEAGSGDFTDLDLGHLDADALFEAYSIPNMAGVNPLEKYIIKKVEVQVGLQPSVDEKIRTSVEGWLSKRVDEEFGKVGSSKVQFIENPDISSPSTHSWMKLLKELQDLVGHLIIALAIILGVFLWKMLAGNSSNEKSSGASSQINIENKTEAGAGSAMAVPAGEAGSSVLAQDPVFVERMSQLSTQVRDLAPKITDQLESLIEEWCEHGSDGLYQVAYFAEVSGSVLGRLPIPKEHRKKMSDIFSEMHAMSDEEKLELANRTYWDLVASLNLGTDALHRPFSFINKSALMTVNNVLMENNSDTQAVVTLYMPENMRRDYLSNLEETQKVDLLNSAAKLSVISEEALQNIEDKIAPYFGEKTLDSEVSMDLTLAKLIESLAWVDSCKILPQIHGPVIEQFRVSQPHIAFLSQWAPGSLSVLVKSSTNEELLAYLRIVPDMTHRVLEFTSPRARKILEDDLEQTDGLSDSDKESNLGRLQNRIISLINNGDISFEKTIVNNEGTSEEEIDLAA